MPNLSTLPLSVVVVLHAALAPTLAAAVDFKKELLPVIQAKCLKCHSAPHEEKGTMVKPKGELRLDAAWAMLRGGESKRPSLVPKDPAKSYMYEVVTLPKDDDMFMPSKGEPFSEKEVAILKTWIEEGADFGGWEGNLEGKPAEAPTPSKAPPKDRDYDLLYKALADGLQPASDEALKKTAAAGAQASTLMVNNPLLRVDFLTGVSKCNDESLVGLAPIKDQIAHMDLARTSITDAGLKTVALFPRLTRLDLRKTQITDKGVESLSALKHLTYLNLYGTAVTDLGIATLAGMKSLRNVYLWETKVTEAGVAKLKKALPDAEIVSNVQLPAPEAPEEADGKGGKKKKDK